MSGANSINGSVLIDRPIMDVYQYFSNPDRLREWVPFYSAVDVPAGYAKAKEPKSFGVTVGMAPWEFKDTVTIVDAVMGRSLTYRSDRFAVLATYLFEPTSKGTVVTAMHMPWGVAAFTPLLSFARPWNEHIVNQALLQLKQRLEALRHRPSPPMIFFSYRRKEDRYTGGRVVETLEREFGEGSVFRDIDSMSSGNFEEQIVRAIKDSEIVVVLVAPGWFDSFAGKAKASTTDYVKKELLTALGHKKEIVLLLTDGALLPDATLEKMIAGLPKELRALEKLHFHKLRSDPDFRGDMERVLRVVWNRFAKSERWREAANR